MSSTTQYDSFATDYSSTTNLPGEVLTSNLLRRGLGDIHNLNILDLACGDGLHSRTAISLGARSVTGVDISGEMLKVGQAIEDKQQQNKKTSPDRRHGAILYHQADCSKPLTHLPFEPASFDLVMANWLFNYASTRTELVDMWQNVSLYLRPGGRFVGVGELHEVSSAEARNGAWIGIRASSRGESESGEATIIHTELLSEPKIEFDSFIPKEAALYRRIPLELGMQEVKFQPPSLADVPEECRETQEWKQALVNPYCLLCTAVKG